MSLKLLSSLSTPAPRYLPQYIIDKTNGDVEVYDKTGITPLHLAADRNHLAVARLLLTARCNPSVSSSAGDQPIHWAATKGHMEVGGCASCDCAACMLTVW